MAMHTETLSSAWYEFTDLDDDTYVMAVLAGDDCDVIAASEEPDTNATAFTIYAGINRLDVTQGKTLWIRCPTGTCDLTYSKFGGIVFDVTKCKTVASDGTDSQVTTGEFVVSGYPAETGTYPPTLAFLESQSAGLISSATVNSAVLNLSFMRAYTSGTFRVFGIESGTSQSAAIVDYADLNTDLPRTSAYAEFEVGHSGKVSVDVAAIVQELLGASGWDTASPIQFVILPYLMTPDGTDQQIAIIASVRQTAVFVNAS